MAAPIQQIEYDLERGKTILTFGPAAHLGAKDFVERLRINRGPRAFYTIGGNLANADANLNNQLGANTTTHAPSAPAPINNNSIDPNNLPDLIAHQSTYGVNKPGITRDAAGASGYGGIGAPGAAVIHLQKGSNGSLGSFARLDAAAALNLQSVPGAQEDGDDEIQWISLDFADMNGWPRQVFLRELPECDLIDGVVTSGFRLYLCSQFYTGSIGTQR